MGEVKVSLCLIVWNELEGCKIDVPQLPLHTFHEVFAVDGGSTDGTVQYLQGLGIRVHRQRKPGLNAAYVDANELATGGAVVVYFPKGSLPPLDVLKFRRFFEEGKELVIASRQIAGSYNEEDSHLFKPRKWAVRALAVSAAMVWRREGPWVRDVLHGFKGWTRSAFARMNILDVGLSIDLEMVIRAYKLRIPRIEFPTRETSRGYGQTHFKMWPTGKRLLSYLWFELRRDD